MGEAENTKVITIREMGMIWHTCRKTGLSRVEDRGWLIDIEEWVKVEGRGKGWRILEVK